MTLIVDTLRFSKLLQDKGHFSPEQADTLAATIGTVGTENLATKTDIAEVKVLIADLRTELKGEIAELRAELKAEIADLKAELKADIAGLRSEVQKWIIGAVGLQTLVMVGLVLTLAKALAK